MAPDHRAIAICHLLREFDLAAPDTYSEPEARRQLFDRLIAEHNLKEPNPRGPRRNLSRDRYAELLKQVIQGGGSTVKAFCANGSKALAEKYLNKVSYTAPVQEANGNSSPAVESQAPTNGGRSQVLGRPVDAHAHPALPVEGERASPRIRISTNAAQRQNYADPPGGAANNSLSNKQTTGGKRPHSEIDDPGQVAGPVQKSPRLDAAASPTRLTLTSSPVSSPAAAEVPRDNNAAPGGKRKRASIGNDDEDTTSDRPAKSARPLTSAAEMVGAKESQPAFRGIPASGAGTAKAKESPPASSALSTSGAGTAKARRSQPASSALPASGTGTFKAKKSQPEVSARPAQRANTTTGEKRKHDLVDKEGTDADAPPQHPMFAQKGIAPPAKRVRTEADPPLQPGREYLIHKAVEDPFGPHCWKLDGLGDDDIYRHLNSIWHKIEMSAMGILGRPERFDAPLAQFVVNPQPELAELYRTLLGANWREQAAVQNLTQYMSSHNLVEGCIAAAVFRYVYDKPAQWQSPRDLLGSLHAQHHIEALNEYFEYKTGGNMVSIQEAAWWSAKRQLKSPDFPRRVLRPIAEELAKTLWTVIQPQLLLFGMPRMDAQKAKHLYEKQTAVFTEIFEQALHLQAKMGSAPDGCTASWIESGVPLDKMTMEDLTGGEEPREVAWCVSPRIDVHDREGTPPRRFCFAKVFGRKSASA